MQSVTIHLQAVTTSHRLAAVGLLTLASMEWLGFAHWNSRQNGCHLMLNNNKGWLRSRPDTGESICLNRTH